LDERVELWRSSMSIEHDEDNKLNKVKRIPRPHVWMYLVAAQTTVVYNTASTQRYNITTSSTITLFVVRSF